MKTLEFLGNDFEIVSYDTKKGKQLSTRCENYDGYYLSQVYGRFSETKRKIWDYWYNVYCNDLKGDTWGIVSHNAQYFSVGWFSNVNGKDVALLITPTHNYMIVYPD